MDKLSHRLDLTKQRLIEHGDTILVCVSLLLFLTISCCILGDYQNWGGDFAQYVTQARNLLWGRPWSFGMTERPAIMPFYPLLVAVFYAIFGHTFFPIALANTLMWSGVVLCYWLLYRRNFTNRYWLLLAFLSTLFSPFVMAFQQEAQPNICYAFAVAICLLILNSTNRKQQVSQFTYCMLFALLLGAGMVRTTALALHAAVALYGLVRRERIWILLGCTAAITVVIFEQFLASSGAQYSNFHVFGSMMNRALLSPTSVDPAFTDRAAEILRMLFSFFSVLSNELTPHFHLPFLHHVPFIHRLLNNSHLIWHPLLPFALVIFGLGSRHCLRQTDHDPRILFFFCHLLLISSSIQMYIPKRYICAILPIFIFTSYIYIDRLFLHASRLGRTLLLALSLLVATHITVTNIQRAEVPKLYNAVRSDSLKKFSAWYHEHMDLRSSLAFFKPRVMFYLIDHKDNIHTPRSIRQIRTLKACQQFFAGEVPWSRLALFRDKQWYHHMMIKEFCEQEETIDTTWKEGGFVVYVKKGQLEGKTPP